MVNILIFSSILFVIQQSISAPMVHKVDSSVINNQECQRSMTYEEVQHLLMQSPCAASSNRKYPIKREDNNNPTSISHNAKMDKKQR